MTKFVTEMLDEINADPAKIEEYKNSNAMKLVFEFAFNPANRFVLPEGNPPYKEDAAPLGMSPANLLMELKRLYVFCRADLQAIRRETLFVQLLENVHPSEAKVVLAIKDQSLTKLYKKITHKLVYDAGLVTVAPEVKQTKKARILAGADL